MMNKTKIMPIALIILLISVFFLVNQADVSLAVNSYYPGGLSEYPSKKVQVEEYSITFPGDSGPINTGIFVQNGEYLQISASGVIHNGISNHTPDGHCGPSDPSYLPILPTISSNSLIGSIGDFSTGILLDDGFDIDAYGYFGSDCGYPNVFGPGYVGSLFGSVVPVDGNIYLAFNDYPLGDNSGSFDIDITIYSNYATIKGQVTDGFEQPISNVLISGSNSNRAITGLTGHYTMTGLITGTHSITPTARNYLFRPVSKTVPVPPDQDSIDFKGSLLEYPNWLASESAIDCDGPNDRYANPWYENEFDDRDWTLITPPTINTIDPGEDRFYRTVFTPTVSGEMTLSISSDDGIWLYINEQFIGQWGDGCHEGCCFGDVPWACGTEYPRIDIDISPYLVLGEPNRIAAHVTNALQHGPDWSYFAVSLVPEFLAFELPIEYEGRDSSSRAGFYEGFQFQMTSLFDHSVGGDNILLPFTGLGIDVSAGCSLGVDCYDGHEGWDFDDRDNQTAVYPVAAGTIVADKSGYGSDGYGYRVCIQHGDSGYSTLYGHLQSDDYLTSGEVITSTQIGIIGQTGCADSGCGTHLHLSTYYDPDEACKWGTQIDPSGWMGYETDPNEIQTGLKSFPLWVHPISVSTQVHPDSEATLSWQDLDTRIRIPAGAYTDTILMRLAIAPNKEGTEHLVSNGNIFYLTAFDRNGEEIHVIDTSMEIQIVVDESDLGNIDPGSIKIHQYNLETRSWVELTTTIVPATMAMDFVNTTSTLVAETNLVAPFALLGEKINYVFVPIINSD